MASFFLGGGVFNERPISSISIFFLCDVFPLFIFFYLFFFFQRGDREKFFLILSWVVIQCHSSCFVFPFFFTYPEKKKMFKMFEPEVCFRRGRKFETGYVTYACAQGKPYRS